MRDRGEFLKLYVAYKAETNFVDVVPQAKRLRLSLNMDFHEIHDPKGLAKDVTGLGRWGNGDVRWDSRASRRSFPTLWASSARLWSGRWDRWKPCDWAAATCRPVGAC